MAEISALLTPIVQRLDPRGAAPAARVALNVVGPEQRRARRTVRAAVLDDAPPAAAGGGGALRIRARVEPDRRSCSFLVDRPLLEGASLHVADAATAAGAPLAARLLAIEGVAAVTLRGRTAVVRRAEGASRDLDALAAEIGGAIRAHLEAGEPVVLEHVMRSPPASATLERRLQEVVERSVNPGLAAHGGRLTLERVEGNTAYVRMSGGCQGCGAAGLTLREGVERMFRDAVPTLGAIIDLTDHASGGSPYVASSPETPVRRLRSLSFRIQTGARGIAEVPRFEINGFTLPLSGVQGGCGAGETLTGTGRAESFPHSLLLCGPEAGAWDIDGLDITYALDGDGERRIRLGAVSLEPGSDLDLWYEPAPDAFDV
ncbi:NifU family protein [Sorangium sp. So ce260]|uniref:NifU family protein n=1 Tax=Sorangium sp. So ce260 TaxID=3133291 RepID=UPI003F5F12FC